MPGTLLISRHLPEEALALARTRATVRLPAADRRLQPAELAAQLRDADGLVCLLTDTIDETLLTQAPRLRSSRTWPSGTTTSTWPPPAGGASWSPIPLGS